MSFTFEKVADLKYDELTSLYIIETDDLLKELFTEKVKLPFNILYKFIKTGDESFNKEIKYEIFQLFDKIILTRESLAERYQHLLNTNHVDNLLSKKLDDKTNSHSVDAIKETTPKQETIVIKIKKEKSLPRRYGKDKIQKDIKEQGSPATPLQRAMIDLNDVRNLYVKLSDRGIKDLLGGGENFTEEDCRKISAIVKTFKQQAEAIINKKK